MLAAPGVETPAVTVSAPAPTPVVIARATPTAAIGPAVGPRQSPIGEVTAVGAPRAIRQGVTHPSLWIQVGAYHSTVAAGRVAAEVHGEILVVASPSRPEPPLLRVRVGPFPDRARALERLHQLQAEEVGAVARPVLHVFRADSHVAERLKLHGDLPDRFIAMLSWPDARRNQGRT